MRRHLEYGVQQVAAAAAYVDDPASCGEVVGRQDGRGVAGRPRAHRPTEHCAFRRHTGEVAPQAVGIAELDRRATGADRVSQLVEGLQHHRQAHHLGERAHRHRVVAAQQPGRGAVLISAAGAGEHAVRGQQAERPVQSVRVDGAPSRQFVRRDRAVLDVVGDAELGHDVQASGGHARIGHREDQLVRLHDAPSRSWREPGCGRPTRRIRAATGSAAWRAARPAAGSSRR